MPSTFPGPVWCLELPPEGHAWVCWLDAPISLVLCHLSFVDEESQAQRGSDTCLWSPSCGVVGLRVGLAFWLQRPPSFIIIL